MAMRIGRCWSMKPVISAMVMTGAAVAAILYRPRSQVLNFVGWTSIALVVVYLLNSFALFLVDGG